MVIYEANVIYKFADRLYRKANLIIACYTILGLLLGGVGGYFLGHMAAEGYGPLTVTIVAVLGSIIGCVVGSEKAFMLKLLAQMALCQVQIEQNTSGKLK